MAPFMLLLLFLSGAASEPIEVTVNPGDDVTLSCQAADSSIRVVKWTRPDLEPDTVFFYIDGRLYIDNQHPFFKDRVELVDRVLKDGDVSLKLKNVSRQDTGTYTCGVKTDDTDLIRTIRTVHLQVPERGSEDRNSSPGGRDGGLVAGVLVVLVLVAAAVGGVLMYRRRQKKRPGPPAASPDLTVTVDPGDDVILPCQAAGSSIRTLKWTREDLDPDTVLLYRDGDLKLDHQHPDFKDRVELVDRDLEDGVVSLKLKNVSINDTGTYECRVKTDDTDLIRTIRIICLQVPDLTVVTVDPGGDVILSCQAAGSSIRAVKWTRDDLEPTDTVLLYRDGHLETDNQNPSFKDRVELVDRDLEDGDVSLILKNVNRHDTGTYECRVITNDTDLIRTIRTVRLQVPDLIVVTVDPGGDVILSCQAADSSIRAVKWTRPDLEPTDTVLLYRDGHLETDNQNPSFEDRVELVDRDLEDGDVSLKLMNVNRHDAGKYECRVASGDSFRFIRTVHLKIPDPAVPVIETPLLEVSSMD